MKPSFQEIPLLRVPCLYADSSPVKRGQSGARPVWDAPVKNLLMGFVAQETLFVEQNKEKSGDVEKFSEGRQEC
jgi:hypothetical protein